MPSIASRTRKSASSRNGPRRGFAPGSVSAAADSLFNGGIAGSAGGVMAPDLPIEASKKRRVEMQNQDKGSVALRTVTYPVFGASTQANYTSEDGSAFTISTQDAPMHIPGAATNLTASLVNASVPYVWNNLKQDQTINVEGSFPRRVSLKQDISVNYTVRQPSGVISDSPGEGAMPTENAQGEQTRYLADSQREPFWYRPGVIDAFGGTLGLEGAFDQNTRLTDQSSSSATYAIRQPRSSTLIISYTATGTPVAFGNVTLSTITSELLYKDIATADQFDGRLRRTIGNSPVTIGYFEKFLVPEAGQTAKMQFIVDIGDNIAGYPASAQAPFDFDLIIAGTTISNTELAFISISNSTLDGGAELSGANRTGSPMIRFGRKVAGTNTSTSIMLDYRSLGLLKSIPSAYTYTIDAYSATCEAVISFPLVFDNILCDAMNAIYQDLSTSFTTRTTDYVQAMHVNSITLASFTMVTGLDSDGILRPTRVNIVLKCDPLHDTDLSREAGGWYLVTDLHKIGEDPLSNYIDANRTSGTFMQHNGNIVNSGGVSNGTQSMIYVDPPQNVNRISIRKADGSLNTLFFSVLGYRSTAVFANGNISIVQFQGSIASSEFLNVGTPAPAMSQVQVNSARLASGFPTNTNGLNAFKVMDVELFQIGSTSNFRSVSDHSQGRYGANFQGSFSVGDIFGTDIAANSAEGVTVSETHSPTLQRQLFANGYEDPLLQQFSPANASPFVQLPTLQATSAKDYTSLVSHNYSFTLPKGDYNTVQSYLDKVNDLFEQSTALTTGVENLVSLDIEYDGMEADGDTDYDLLVHYNRPMDAEGALASATQTTSGLEPLLNQRVNVNLSNLLESSSDPPVYTRVKEAGDYILLFAENTNIDTVPFPTTTAVNLELLLIHKPSLTVEILTPRDGISTSTDMGLLDADIYVPARGADIVCAVVFNDHVSGNNVVPNIVVWSNKERVWKTPATINVSTGYKFAKNVDHSYRGRVVGVGKTNNGGFSNLVVFGVSGMLAGTSTARNFLAYNQVAIDANGVVAPTSNSVRMDASHPLGGNTIAMVDLEVLGGRALPTTGNNATVDLEILCTTRDVATMSNAYNAVAFRVQDTNAGTTLTGSGDITARTINIEILNNLAAGLYDENNIGVSTSAAITDPVKAAQMPKISVKERFNSLGRTIIAINIPNQTAANASAVMAKFDSNNAAATTYFRYPSTSNALLHDVSNGLCSRVLFTQAKKQSVITGSQDTISLIMNTGHVHPYFFSNSAGIVDGSTTTKDQIEHGSASSDTFDVNTTTASLRFQFSVPTTTANLAIDGVTSNVQDATGSGDETHLFLVGSLVTHGEPGLSEVLVADNFIHRTSEHKDPNQDSIKYFTDKKFPVSIIFNPTSIMEGVWTTTESDFFSLPANVYANFGLDFIANGIHDSTSYNMFTDTNGRGNPLTTVASSTPIVLPKGNYTFQSLGRAINELLHDVDVNTSTYDDGDLVHKAFSMDTIRFENNEALKKLFVGAKLSSSYEDDLPSAISLSWGASTPFAALFSANSISLAATSPEPREYFDALQYTATGLKTIRTIYVQANFVQGGINPQRRKSQILASIPVDKEPGQTLVAFPSIPLKVSAENFLNQGDTNTDLEFLLVDETGEAVAIGTENPWSVNVLIEWEQDINLARLRQSASETRHR